MAEFQIRDAGRLSHAYIISAASASAAQRTARRIAAAAVCTGAGERPCGVCRACRKAMGDIHPDILHIRRLTDSKGNPRREIGVDQIRQMASDAYVLPNEAERKVYIVEDADSMNIPAQNAALKLLEEPPAGAIFLLCVQNAMQLLPTVRSRCVEISDNGESDEADETTAKLAAEFVALVAGGDRLALCAWCNRNEGMDNRAAAAFLESVGSLTADMLCGRESARGMSRRSLLRLRSLSDRCLAFLRVNTGVKHIFGLLAVDAIDSGGNE